MGKIDTHKIIIFEDLDALIGNEIIPNLHPKFNKPVTNENGEFLKELPRNQLLFFSELVSAQIIITNRIIKQSLIFDVRALNIVQDMNKSWSCSL